MEARRLRPARSVCWDFMRLAAGGLLCIRLRAEYRGESLGEAPSSKEQVRRD